MKLAAIYLPVGAKNRKTFGEWYGTSRGSFRPCDQTLESPDSKASEVFFRRFSLPPDHHRDVCAPKQTPSDGHSGCDCDSPSGPCATARARSRTTTLRGASRPITPQPQRDTRWVQISLGLPFVHCHEAHHNH